MAELSHPSRFESTSPLERTRAFFGQYSGTFGSLVLLVLSAWLALTWYQTLQRLVHYYTPLPTWDYWRTAAFLPSYQAFDFRVLWRQHNEHRIVFPEIVFAADYLVLHGRQLLPLSLSFLCYLGDWLALAWAFGREASLPPPVRKVGVLLAGILIGWQGSAVVLSDTFLLQWTLSQFAVLLCLLFLARLKQTAKTVTLLAVILCAVVAAYSSANGLMLWPVVVAAALVLSIGKGHLRALALAAILAIGTYFIGYHFTGTLSIGNLCKHPLYLFEFVGAYLSMPFGAIKSARFGVSVGLLSLALVVMFAIAAVRNRLLASRLGVVLFGWYVFMLLTVLLTAAGRMNPADPAFSAAKPARYLTGPLVTWAVFVLLSLWLSARLRWRFARPYPIAFVIAVLLLLGLPKLRWWLHSSDEEHAKQQMAALAIELGVLDPNVELSVFPDPPAINSWSKPIRQGRFSVFYQSHGKWLGNNLRNLGTLRDAFIPGEITYTLPVLDGAELAGWVDDSQVHGSHGWIVLADETGRIVGFGRKLPAGVPDMLDNPRTPRALGWVGFVNQSAAAKSVSAYAIAKESLLPIEGSVELPAVRVIARDQAGPQIEGIAWQADPSWRTNGLPPGAFFGQGPRGVIYASWSGDDRNTGRITSTVFAAPAKACLILPVLQGPNGGGLSAGVIDADTSQVIASVPFQNTVHQWTFWRLPLPAAGRLRIFAQDTGKNWGEWLAIGNPSKCN